jgi:phosphatidylglycerol:prolipoprotein diacylglycerol transferase
VPAVISLSFDPVIVLTETASVRIETIALAVVLFGGLALAMRIGSVTPDSGPYVPPPGLRPGDLVLMALAGVPGAILGGRLGYVLDHLDFYRANPEASIDPAQGALTLTLAVPLGLLTGGLIGRLIGAPVGRWMHAVALPLLFVLGAGKLVGVLGATGQGLPSDLPWATAYAGPGPWGSLAPELPSHPAQVYEAIAVGFAMLGVAALARVQPFARRNGATLFAALALWAICRVAVGFAWRDLTVVGPLRVEQLLGLIVLVIAFIGVFERGRSRHA